MVVALRERRQVGSTPKRATVASALTRRYNQQRGVGLKRGHRPDSQRAELEALLLLLPGSTLRLTWRSRTVLFLCIPHVASLLRN